MNRQIKKFGCILPTDPRVYNGILPTLPKGYAALKDGTTVIGLPDKANLEGIFTPLVFTPVEYRYRVLAIYLGPQRAEKLPMFPMTFDDIVNHPQRPRRLPASLPLATVREIYEAAIASSQKG